MREKKEKSKSNTVSRAVSAFPELPQRIIIIPMRDCPVFPGLFTTIEVSDPMDIETVKYAGTYPAIGLLLLRNTEKTSAELCADDFCSIGTAVKVRNQIATIYGSRSLYIETICRFRIKDLFFEKGLISADVEYIEEDSFTPIEEKALLNTMRAIIAKRDDRTFLVENLKFNASNISEAARLADYLAGMIVPQHEQQEFLENLNAKDRILKILFILNQELSVQKLHEEIQIAVNKKMDKHQREYFLREELKTIKDELDKIQSERNGGETEELSSDDIRNGLNRKSPKNLKSRLLALHLKGEAAETVFSEYDRLENTERYNSEYSIIRTYLETVADLPWNTASKDDFSMEEAKTILENDHYGIKVVKQRILEFLAVRKLKNDTKGAIICLVGPPGTGKTSVGLSIAKALHKKYYRFSVGGMRDEAEIKGHRRTYIGAMPGQIIKGLKIAKTNNPVFVIDEIDKMGVSVQGDPASALLEALDPEQNSAFRDHYLDIPFDISSVLFVVTANSTDTIPRPLLDRMEVIEMSGYTSEEKLSIGSKYLLPKSRARNGLKTKDVQFSTPVLHLIAEEYAREAGVRNFEKSIDKINRKVAMELVTDPDTERPVKITKEKVHEYLGLPPFPEDNIIKVTKPGMSIGLAWTQMGGDVLAIEAQGMQGRGNLNLTGQLGDVMKESAAIALSYIKSISGKYGIDSSWFRKNDIHLHVPEGATPKDGPSAGITMATALFSLVTGKIMAQDTAMTGELSLLGKVMPIGGLREKILAAKRNRIKTIIIPAQNSRDLEKLDESIRKNLTFHLVSDMTEVLDLVF